MKGHTVSSVCDGQELLELLTLPTSATPVPTLALTPTAASTSLQVDDPDSIGKSCDSPSKCFDVVLVDRYMPTLEGPKAIRCVFIVLYII